MTELSRRAPQDVNIKAGDAASKDFYDAARQSYSNRPGLLQEFHESFSGMRAVRLGNLPDVDNLFTNMDSDGVGTKIEIAERVQDHSTVAHDLFAMACDDAVVRGAEPVTINTVLEVNSLGKEDDPDELKAYIHRCMQELAVGYVAAARSAKVVISGGEIAEVGDRVGGHGPFNYNWSATISWLAHEKRVLTGHQINPGDTLIGLAEQGFRSNGITDVRKAMLEEYGEQWHDKTIEGLGNVTLGRLIQRPSIIYSGFMSELTGGYDITRKPMAKITGAAHITGGGQPSKLGRMLEPSGLGVEIANPIAPPNIMLMMQQLRNYDDRTAYNKWHMGPGMVIATPEPDAVLEAADEYGISAQEIGKVTSKSGIRIRNSGAGNDSKWLNFSPDAA